MSTRSKRTGFRISWSGARRSTLAKRSSQSVRRSPRSSGPMTSSRYSRRFADRSSRLATRICWSTGTRFMRRFRAGSDCRPIPRSSPARAAPRVDCRRALKLLRALHTGRNDRPVADTIWRLLEATRAHAGLPFDSPVSRRWPTCSTWRSSRAAMNQAEASRSGAFSKSWPTPLTGVRAEAPILEEGSDGVRLMTVHKAKGWSSPS